MACMKDIKILAEERGLTLKPKKDQIIIAIPGYSTPRRSARNEARHIV